MFFKSTNVSMLQRPQKEGKHPADLKKAFDTGWAIIGD